MQKPRRGVFVTEWLSVLGSSALRFLRWVVWVSTKAFREDVKASEIKPMKKSSIAYLLVPNSLPPRPFLSFLPRASLLVREQRLKKSSRS